MIPALYAGPRLSLRPKEVLRLLDYPEDRALSARVQAALEEAIKEGRALASVRGSARSLDPAEAPKIGLKSIEADALVIGLVTIGPALEKRIQAHARSDQLLRALLLDAVGSAAAEEAADRMSAHFIGAETKEPTPIGCRLSPGYGSWSLDAQKQLFAQLSGQEIGVSLTPSCMMVPRKSISFALWLGAREKPAQGLAGCADCTLHNCRYRRTIRRPPHGS